MSPARERPADQSVTKWWVSVYATQPTGSPRFTIRRTVEFLNHNGQWSPHVRHQGQLFPVYCQGDLKYILMEEASA